LAVAARLQAIGPDGKCGSGIDGFRVHTRVDLVSVDRKRLSMKPRRCPPLSTRAVLAGARRIPQNRLLRANSVFEEPPPKAMDVSVCAAVRAA
jgi:hypothetical protein